MSLERRASKLVYTAATVNTRLGNMENIVDRIGLAMYEHEDGDFQKPLEDQEVINAVPEFKADLLKCDAAWQNMEVAFNGLQDCVDRLMLKWTPKRDLMRKRLSQMHTIKMRFAGVPPAAANEALAEGAPAAGLQDDDDEQVEDVNKRPRNK